MASLCADQGPTNAIAYRCMLKIPFGYHGRVTVNSVASGSFPGPQAPEAFVTPMARLLASDKLTMPGGESPLATVIVTWG